MLNVKVGMFPGRLEDYALEEGTTVREALEMAGITVGEEQEIKLDGEVVSGDTKLTVGSGVLIVAKRIKGAK